MDLTDKKQLKKFTCNTDNMIEQHIQNANNKKRVQNFYNFVMTGN
jgi:hypothetical protein